MASQPVAPNTTTCQFKRENGELCKRNVSLGEGRCWQHARSWRHKFKSLTRNQTAAFIVGIVGLILALLIGVPSLYYSYLGSRHIQPLEHQHTHVQYINPDSAPQPTPPTLPFIEGQPASINIGFANLGNEVADNCYYNAAIHIQRGLANEEEMFTDFLAKQPMIKCQQMMPSSQGNFGYQYHTFLTPKLSAADVADLNHGNAGICATSRVLWSDKTGKYRTEYCGCLESSYQTFPQSPVMAWHGCTTHNGETKLP
jgi:hypothetical protein